MYSFTPQTQYTIVSRGVEMTLRCATQPGYVYLIHFSQKYHHAAHYLGSCIDLEARLALHRAGRGARLLEVVNDAGISWHISKIWQCESPEAARLLEAKYKRQHHDGRLCPECLGKPLDPLTLLYQGHFPFSVFEKPGRRKPLGLARAMYYTH